MLTLQWFRFSLWTDVVHRPHSTLPSTWTYQDQGHSSQRVSDRVQWREIDTSGYRAAASTEAPWWTECLLSSCSSWCISPKSDWSAQTLQASFSSLSTLPSFAQGGSGWNSIIRVDFLFLNSGQNGMPSQWTLVSLCCFQASACLRIVFILRGQSQITSIFRYWYILVVQQNISSKNEEVHHLRLSWGQMVLGDNLTPSPRQI